MNNKQVLCTTKQFHELLEILKQDGYKLLGPTVRNEVVILDTITSANDLPIGWTDEQEPGYYRLKKRNDEAYFGYNLGPHSWKQFLFPAKEKLLRATKNEQTLALAKEMNPPIEKMAFLGVHPCEIQAMVVQDTVFKNSVATYEQYKERREKLFIFAMNCTKSVHTCFCTSMNTGPEVKDGYDLALTEIIEPNRHVFVLTIGSPKGQALLDKLSLPPADKEVCEAAQGLIDSNKDQLRQVDADHVHEMLLKSWDCKRWDSVSERCINCTNCTMVCPTCFCSEIKDTASLDGKEAERWQSWDSCFNLSHSYVHGGPIRQSAKSRYRQWLTHKFGTWWDQFAMSGCVGCGRCITWCPVGIDVTEELRELQLELDTTKRE